MSLRGRVELEEDFLYTDISPEFTQEGEKTINEYFREEIARADEVDISVAYCSCDSLRELDRLVEERKIKRICLIIGMYFFIGFAKKLYKLVLKIHKKWAGRGIGEIRLNHFFYASRKTLLFLQR